MFPKFESRRSKLLETPKYGALAYNIATSYHSNTEHFCALLLLCTITTVYYSNLLQVCIGSPLVHVRECVPCPRSAAYRQPLSFVSSFFFFFHQIFKFVPCGKCSRSAVHRQQRSLRDFFSQNSVPWYTCHCMEYISCFRKKCQNSVPLYTYYYMEYFSFYFVE